MQHCGLGRSIGCLLPRGSGILAQCPAPGSRVRGGRERYETGTSTSPDVTVGVARRPSTTGRLAGTLCRWCP